MHILKLKPWLIFCILPIFELANTTLFQTGPQNFWKNLGMNGEKVCKKFSDKLMPTGYQSIQ